MQYPKFIMRTFNNHMQWPNGDLLHKLHGVFINYGIFLIIMVKLCGERNAITIIGFNGLALWIKI